MTSAPLVWLLLACPGATKESGPSDSPSESARTESTRTESPTDSDTGCSPTVVVWDDADGDGYGDPTTERSACEIGKGQVTQGGDCDDEVGATHPGASETPSDGVDSDCSGYDECGEGAVYVGEFRPWSVEELETFCDTWSEVDGDFLVKGDTGRPDWTADLTTLESVSCLCGVSGSLGVMATEQLVDLHGLERVTDVGALYLLWNYQMESFEGLGSLRRVTAEVEISAGPVPDLEGLGALEEVGGYASLGSLDSANGLDHLVSVGEGLIRVRLNLDDAHAALCQSQVSSASA